MTNSLVSVIIPNYNYAHYVREAIDSVLAQTYSNIEIIVVDDGSNDGSRKVLASYGDQIKTVFQQNQGVASTRNNGVNASSGEYVAFLDADDAWMPEKVKKQVSRFEADKTLGLVHVGVIEVDENGNTLLERLEGLEGDVAAQLLLLKREGILGGGSGLMVRQKVFDETGGFDTRLSTSADWDLFYQISSRYQVGFVPELLLKYRIHNSNMHSNVRVMEQDMTTAFDKIFQGASTPLSRDSYGGLYKTLAGSYFRAGDYGGFIRSAAKSVGYRPGNLGYFLKFPLRRLKAQQ
jgi:glycosyltransferase involved in cell wall biosynthesis